MPSLCKFSFCEVCKRTQPPRVEHCPICKCCVMKIDHHCVWIGNTCVGFKNHKFFVLYLLYFSMGALITTVPYYFTFLNDFGFITMMFDALDSIIVFLLSMCIWLATFCLLCMQFVLIKNNQTTLEFAKSTKQPFKLPSLLLNFEAVFGKTRMDWWNPFQHPFDNSSVWLNLEMQL